MDSIFFTTRPAILGICLLIGMLGCMKLGSIAGRRIWLKNEGDNPGNGIILTALFALFGLLLGFTFSMSGSRFENRRQNVVKEANAIGTAILRADLYPPELRSAFRKEFKIYTQSRIDYLQAGVDIDLMNRSQVMNQGAANKLWELASQKARDAGTVFPANLMIPSLNEMFDSANSMNYAEKLKVPASIVLMLFVLCLVTSFFMGYQSAYKGKLDWFIVSGFCLLCVLVICVTLDLDNPRRGLIQMETSKTAMTELMKEFDRP